MKMRKKSGLRREQMMYQGSAVRQKLAIATGWRQRKASRQRLVNAAQSNMPPPDSATAAGPFASVARPRKKPKKIKASQGVRGVGGDCGLRVRPRMMATKTSATVSVAAKGMSVAAAWEKPTMPTVVGRRSSNHRAVHAP